jgi:hypothetical protein
MSVWIDYNMPGLQIPNWITFNTHAALSFLTNLNQIIEKGHYIYFNLT